MFDLEGGHCATVGVEDPHFREIKSLGLMDADRWTGVSCLHGCGCLAGDGKHCDEQLWRSQQAGRVLLENECYTNQVDTANPVPDAVVDQQRLGQDWWGIHQTQGSTCTKYRPTGT